MTEATAIPASAVISVFQMMTREVLSLKDAIDKPSSPNLVDISELSVVDIHNIINICKSFANPTQLLVTYKNKVITPDGNLYTNTHLKFDTEEERNANFELICKGVWSHRDRVKILASK